MKLLEEFLEIETRLAGTHAGSLVSVFVLELGVRLDRVHFCIHLFQ